MKYQNHTTKAFVGNIIQKKKAFVGKAHVSSCPSTLNLKHNLQLSSGFSYWLLIRMTYKKYVLAEKVSVEQEVS